MLKFKFIPFLIIFTFLFYECSQNNLRKISSDLKNNPIKTDRQGLVGGWYLAKDLTRPGGSNKLTNLDIKFDMHYGYGSDWSAQWVGYLTAPVDGEVILYGETNREMILKFGDKEIIHVGEENEMTQAKIDVRKGEKYPIHLIYLQKVGGPTYLKLAWSWGNEEKHAIPPEAVSFTEEQANYWNYIEKPQPEDFDFSQLNNIPVENYIAYYDSVRYAGWAANNGIWTWGNEILVGFSLGYYNPIPTGAHAFLNEEPFVTAMVRSLDGGKSWKLEIPEGLNNSQFKETPTIDFSNPDIILKFEGIKYYASPDRGKNWDGPYKVNLIAENIPADGLTSRTDYIITGPKEALVFMSAKNEDAQSYFQDRSFCTITTDGGKTFQFLGWITHNNEIRSVMSSSVQIEKDHLVSVVRRRYDEKNAGDRVPRTQNYIEAAKSKDNGKTWVNLGKVAETDLGERNGNPPSMVKLPDGRLCVAYGYRDFPYGIRMKVSNDNGHTWGKEYAVRTDGTNWDLGYPRMTLNAEGKIVVLYYISTKERKAQHLGVSIVDPSDLK